MYLSRLIRVSLVPKILVLASLDLPGEASLLSVTEGLPKHSLSNE